MSDASAFYLRGRLAGRLSHFRASLPALHFSPNVSSDAVAIEKPFSFLAPALSQADGLDFALDHKPVEETSGESENGFCAVIINKLRRRRVDGRGSNFFVSFVIFHVTPY